MWFPKGEFDYSPEAVHEQYIAFIRVKYPRSESEIMTREQVTEALKKAKLARKICDGDFLVVCVGMTQCLIPHRPKKVFKKKPLVQLCILCYLFSTSGT